MPHYADGVACEIGDLVRGKPYNTSYEVTGVVVGVVSDSETCNLRVAFAEPAGHTNGAIVFCGYDPAGRMQNVKVNVDYGETLAFSKIA